MRVRRLTHTMTHTPKGLERIQAHRKEYSARCACFFSALHDLFHDISHGLSGIILFLPRGMSVGAEGKTSVVVAQHTGHGFDIHTILQGCSGKGVPLWHNKDKSENPCSATG